MRRDHCIAELLKHRTNEIVVAVYHAAFDLLRIQPHPLNYYSVGAMGLCSSHAIGLALGRPDKKVIALDGDGSLLMNLGALVTMAEIAPKNLLYFVCENGTYEANGGHPIPGRGVIRLIDMAKAAGFRQTREYSDLLALAADAHELLSCSGPLFVSLKIEPGDPSPKDWEVIHGPASRARFRAALEASAI